MIFKYFEKNYFQNRTRRVDGFKYVGSPWKYGTETITYNHKLESLIIVAPYELIEWSSQYEV